LKNRQHSSPHDFAGDNGIYIYHVTNANSFPPNITADCADGNWNFTFNTSSLTITRTTPNPSGNNELNYSYPYGGTTYACYRPVYPTDAMWGDSYDAFDPTYNNVFSPVSNPRSINNAGVNFTIETTGSNSIAVYFTNPYAGSPSKPQNFHRITSVDNHPTLQWDLNSEPDISSYKIYRSYDNSPFEIAGTVSCSTNTFVDVNVDYTKPIWEKPVKYYVAALDNQSKYSVPSDQVKTTGQMDILIKSISERKSSDTEVEKEQLSSSFELLGNYPNPFNPTTTIKYQLSSAGFITLKVYDMLGREIQTLVNGYKDKGYYEVSFDASDLASGVYIYQLRTNVPGRENYVSIKKMMLVK